MLILWMLAAIIFFVLLEGFFSGSEMALISVNRIKMEQLAQSKISQAVLLRKMLASPDRLLSTTLVGTNISVVISSAIFTFLVISFLSEGHVWLTSVVMSPIILIFGEAIPKVIFRYYADTITFKIARLIRAFQVLFWPVVVLVSSISRIMLFPLQPKEGAKKSLFVTREELKLLIKESKKDADIKPYERAMVHRIFEFGSKKVKEVMVPLKDVVSIGVSETPLGLKELAKTSGYSRILVYEGEKQNIIGFANVFDVLYDEGKIAKVGDGLRPVLYISQESHVDQVFYALQLKRIQVAVLIDEHKKHVGMVTFKDLLDEIVGEI